MVWRRVRAWPRGAHISGTTLAAMGGLVCLLISAGILFYLGWRGDDVRRRRSPAPATSEQVRPSTSTETPLGGTSAPPQVAEPAETGERDRTKAPEARAVVAFQPSHQDDTGEGWHEYAICGHIVDEAIAALRRVRGVKAWDIEHGLTGSNNYRPQPTNTQAFDVEIARANRHGARYFVSVHNDGGAPTGILAEHMPNDERGESLARFLLRALCGRTGLANRGVRKVELYSLESSRNNAAYRCLLEIGDNVADRAYLLRRENRRLIGQALAAALDDFAARHGSSDGPLKSDNQ